MPISYTLWGDKGGIDARLFTIKVQNKHIDVTTCIANSKVSIQLEVSMKGTDGHGGIRIVEGVSVTKVEDAFVFSRDGKGIEDALEGYVAVTCGDSAFANNMEKMSNLRK